MKPNVAFGIALLLATYTQMSHATEPGGEVQIPLSEYRRLIEAGERADPPPAAFAIGAAKIDVRVEERDGIASGEVRAQVEIDVFGDEWALIPILPAATPVTSVLRGEDRVQLVPGPDGLSFATRRAGAHTLVLSYRVDARQAARGASFVLALPTPAAAATEVSLDLPGGGLEASVIPAVAVESQEAGDRTKIRATVPATRGVQVAWRRAHGESHSLSRAHYVGTLRGDAIEWRATLAVELDGERAVRLPVLPAGVTLRDVTVDGAPRPIRANAGFFETEVAGKGSHEIGLAFEVRLASGDGPPEVSFQIPAVPVSHFELELPGEKELRVSPEANVSRTTVDGRTRASFHVPLSEHVSLAWTEAVPGEARTELRASAELFHATHVEEGVLYVRARAAFDVRRGSLDRVALELPGDVQVNEVVGSRGIADWRVAPGDDGQTLWVYLEHPLTGALQLDVSYDRSLRAAGRPVGEMSIPLARAPQVQRQRGMVALLATREVALRPTDDAALTRVGETQLPADFRNALGLKVDHTYKYTTPSPRLAVATAVPERAEAKLDAEVHSLVSLTDVSLEASSSALVRVKTGAVDRLELSIPGLVNVLRLTAPSLRTYRVETRDGRTDVAIELTQEVEGDLRIELGYEWIAQAEGELRIATPSVVGAEAEQGQIGIEARSAVELAVARAEGLTRLDPALLPRQLVLKTTHPILMAYEYIQASPAYVLVLETTRHPEVDVQLATIDSADYRTLVTESGLAVTTARFFVRNTRRQFMRITLPSRSKIWAARVDGRSETPARASGSVPDDADIDGAGERDEILVKLENSAEGFPVELVYATEIAPLESFGTLALTLPRPDMIVTRSTWEWFVPDEGIRFGSPDTNLRLVDSGTATRATPPEPDPRSGHPHPMRLAAAGGLPIDVPAQGRRFRFEKLYANQTPDAAWVSVPYARTGAATLGQVATALGLATFWIAGLGAIRSRELRPPLAGAAAAGLMAATTAALLVDASLWPGAFVSALILLTAAGMTLRARLGMRARDAASAGPADPPLTAPSEGTDAPPRS